MNTTNPEIPEQFTNVFGMGMPKKIYKVKNRTRWLNLVLGVFFLLVTLLLGVVGVSEIYTQVNQHGGVLLETLITYVVGAGVCFLLAVYLFWVVYSNWNKALVTYTNGFAYSDRKGISAWRWDEIESIKSNITRHYTNGIYTGTTHVYTLMKQTGEKLAINDALQKVEDAASDLRAGAYPTLYQKYAGIYNTGQPVCFGPVTISRTGGIQVGKKIYPWEQVKQVSISRGYISIAKKDGGLFSGASVQASNVPNLELMLSIIDQVAGIKTK